MKCVEDFVEVTSFGVSFHETGMEQNGEPQVIYSDVLKCIFVSQQCSFKISEIMPTFKMCQAWQCSNRFLKKKTTECLHVQLTNEHTVTFYSTYVYGGQQQIDPVEPTNRRPKSRRPCNLIPEKLCIVVNGNR